MCDHFEIEADNRHSFFSKWYNKKDRLLSLTIKKMNTKNELDVWKDLAQLKNVIKKLSLKYERMTHMEWRTRLFSYIEPAEHAHVVFKQNQTTLMELSIENVDFTNTIFFDLINDNNISLVSLCVESCIFNDTATLQFSKFLKHQRFIRLFYSRKTVFEKNNLKYILQVLESSSQLYFIEFGNTIEKDQDLSCWRNLFDANTNIKGVSICVTNQKEVDYFCEEILTRRKTKIVCIECFNPVLSVNVYKLTEVLKQNYLTSLYFHNVALSPQFDIGLASNTSLQTIMLYKVNLFFDGFNKHFELFVLGNTNLKFVNFTDCYMDNNRVCSIISKSKSIRKFTLRGGNVPTLLLIRQMMIDLLSSTSLEEVCILNKLIISDFVWKHEYETCVLDVAYTNGTIQKFEAFGRTLKCERNLLIHKYVSEIAAILMLIAQTRQTSLSVFPKDMKQLLGKYLLQTRGDFQTWSKCIEDDEIIQLDEIF